MIAIIDYGMGNLRSVEKAIGKVGYAATVTSNPTVVKRADGVILPGVGAFPDAMDNLREARMIDAIENIIAKEKPFLGICLGLQLLFTTGEENGLYQGLGIINGTVKKLPAGKKIPHMGWNQVEIVNNNPLLAGIPNQSNFYFVHSYHVHPKEASKIVTTTDYGIKFPSIVNYKNIYGIQFHPEKSSTLGLQILKNFGELVNEC
ncbi:glutamine amidotransferase [Desulfitispora alkaliphila]|uniref:imidazole glycerol phosphate synthase subunit HisH n=1 Tax=Desulfitispora alkaliphila TaxID=622674 RepID=UPI003D2480AC